MRRFVALCIAFSFTWTLNAETFADRPADCNTAGKFSPGNTFVTFFGDSRIDYADHYGFDLQHYLLGGGDVDRNPAWDMQNFGLSGQKSDELLGYLKRCFQDTNFQTSTRFAFEIGGNDWLQNVPWLVLFPWSYFVFLDGAARNTEEIVRTLKTQAGVRNGKRTVLLIGNYPTLGIPDTGAGKLEPDYPGAAKPGDMDRWQDFIKSTNFFVLVSLGYAQLEHALPGIAARNDIHYVRVWDAMSDNPILAYPHLMLLDFLHPNHAGFNAWGGVVGAKLVELGWMDAPTASELPMSLMSSRFMLQELQNRLARIAELEGQIRDVDYKIGLIQTRIDDARARIAELEEEIRLADEAERARLEAERIEEENRLREAEEERRREEAEAARLRAEQEAARIAAEQARIAAEQARQREEAERLRREQEERDRLIALCFLFGVCHL